MELDVEDWGGRVAVTDSTIYLVVEKVASLEMIQIQLVTRRMRYWSDPLLVYVMF